MLAFKNAKSIKNYITSSKYPAPYLIDPPRTKEFTALDELNIEHLIALIEEEDYSIIT